LAVDNAQAVLERVGMCSSHPTVTGLVPRAVRLELDDSQAQLLINELLTALETRAGSLREDHDRQRRLTRERLADVADSLGEYRDLLGALGSGAAQPPSAPVVVTVSTPTADALVRACLMRAVEALGELAPARSAPIGRLRDAGRSAAMWAQTLADLRELDESAPDGIPL
jgi:hypothetical protein